MVVGAGVTGSLLTWMLRKGAGSSSPIPIRVVEKELGPGGRMLTQSLNQQQHPYGRADLGAQYISTVYGPGDKRHPVLGPLYEQLSSELKGFEDARVGGANPYGGKPGVNHFAAPKGLGSLSSFLLSESGVEPELGHSIARVDLDDEGRVVLDGKVQDAEVIIFTQPVPQLLGQSKSPILGNFLGSLPQEVRASLEKVQYSSRFAMAMPLPADTAKAWPYKDWDAMYFAKGDVKFVARDDLKRGGVEEGKEAASFLVHSGVPFGIEFETADGPPFAPVITERLMLDLKEKLPEIKAYLDTLSSEKLHLHKWWYSQVYKGYGGRDPDPNWAWPCEAFAPDADKAPLEVEAWPGFVKLFETEKCLGLLAGDAFAPGGKFEGCVYSAARAAAQVRQRLTSASSVGSSTGGSRF